MRLLSNAEISKGYANIKPQAERAMHLLLKNFWNKYRNPVAYSADERLLDLQRMARARIGRIKTKLAKTITRERFDGRRDKKAKREPQCWVCGCPSKDTHHVIPIKNCGENWKKNFISLCAKCHVATHDKNVTINVNAFHVFGYRGY